MNNQAIKLCCLLLIFFYSTDAKLPDFIHVCKKDELDLSKCALKNARIAIPYLVKGYRPYGLPKMTPLNIPKIEIKAGNNLKIDLTDNQVYGLENTYITNVDIQMEKKHMIFEVEIPMAYIIGHYKMNGRILIMPIQGEGPANVTLMNGYYVYSMDFKFINKKGKDYMQIINHHIKFNTTRAYYLFDNLFNGDSILAKQMNEFLNENWKDVTKDLGSTVAETISSIITSIAQSIFTQVPFEEILPE